MNYERVISRGYFISESFKMGCCQLQTKVCARSTGSPLVQACPGKSVVRCTDRPTVAIAVVWDVKQQKQNSRSEAVAFYL